MALTGLLAQPVPKQAGAPATPAPAPVAAGNGLTGLLGQAVPDQKQFEEPAAAAATTPAPGPTVAPLQLPQSTISAAQPDTRPLNTPLTRLGQALLPHFLQSELGIAPEQRQNATPTSAQVETEGGNALTVKQMADNPTKVDPLQYLRAGLSFGNNIDPTNLLTGTHNDITPADLPPAATTAQKVAYGIGQVLTMAIAQPIIDAGAGALTTLAGGGKVLQAISDAAAESPWKIGYPVALAKSTLTGGLFGAITNNKQTLAKNVLDTAGTFAAFTALAYPIQSFFLPIMTKVGEGIAQTNPEAAKVLNDPDITQKPISKTIWFSNPKDPNQLLKVTANGVSFTSKDAAGAALDVPKPPVMTSMDIQAFQKNPSLYENLKSWVAGKFGSVADVPFNADDAIHMDATPVGETGAAAPETAPEAAPEATGEGIRPTPEPGSPEEAQLQKVQSDLQAGKSPVQVTYELANTVGVKEAKDIVAQAQATMPTPTAPAATPAPTPAPAAQAPATTPEPMTANVNENILSKTPAQYQQNFASLQTAHDSKLQSLKAGITALEGQLAAAKPQSQQKKELKQQLATAKSQYKTVSESLGNSVRAHATASHEFLTQHLQDEHGLSPAQAPYAASDVLSHITNPKLVEQHAHTPLKDIATRVAAEHKLKTPPAPKPEVKIEPKAKPKEERIKEIDAEMDALKKDRGGFKSGLKLAALDKEKADLLKEPVTREMAAKEYYEAKVEPLIKEGKTVVVDADEVKKYFGDYNKDNHSIYSQATQDILDRALKEHPGKEFALVGGGPGSGKSEFITKGLVADNFPGVIYDATQSAPEFVSKLAGKAKGYGKSPEAFFIISDPADARFWTLVREAETGREVPHDFFVKTHASYPDTILRLAEDGVPVNALDARGKNGEQIAAEIEKGEYTKDSAAVDIINKMDYSKDTVSAKAKATEQFYANNEQPETSNTKSKEEPSGEREGALRQGGKSEVGNGKENGQEVPDKQIADSTKAIQDAYKAHPKAEEELHNILAEMLELSEPGYRFLDENTDTVKGVNSTFPKWLPDGLKSMDLFRTVFGKVDKIDDLKFPSRSNATRQRELFDYVLAALDYRLGIDTSAERGAILDAYGQESEAGKTATTGQTEVPAVSDSGAQGGEGAKEEIAFSKTPEEKIPRAPKPKVEKKPAEPVKPIDPKDILDMEAAIEKGKPKGFAKSAFNELATLFNPVGQADSRAVDVIMDAKGEYERALFRTEQTFRAVKDMWDKQSPEAALDFMDKVETGDTNDLPEPLRSLADSYRTRLNNMHNAAAKYKDIPFLEHFFPHLWEDKDAVETSNLWTKAQAKRPFQGNKSFTKERVFATIQDGIKAGFVPKTTNPEELVQLYEQNVLKFVMANQIHEDLKPRGYSKYVSTSEKAPEGFTKIDDSITKVYGNPNIPISEAYDQQVFDKLNAVVESLGIKNERTTEMPQGTQGLASEANNSIKTKFASPTSVIAHELGHQIDYKYDLKKDFLGSNNPKLNAELRALADLRYDGKEVTDYYKAYVRNSSEKMAVMLEALVHAPEAFQKVAPETYKKFTDFLASKPELKPILDIKPSLVLGVREDSVYAGGMVIRGEWYVQKDVARLINNFLSPNFLMDTAIGQGIMNMKNTMNAFELGLSAFHFTMETLDTIVTKFSIGLTKVLHGNLTGFGDMLASPLAPLTYFRSGQKFYNGDPELLKIEKDLFTGGASLRSKQYYKNTVFDQFNTRNREILGNIKRGEVFQGAKGVASQILRAPLAAIEATMRPLFSYYIPRLKVGAFRNLFASELLRNSQRIQDGRITRAEVARNTWNNIENRMGELNYDNLFWHRNFKTALMLSTRAVGWNLGTVRELGGALFQDLPKSFGATKASRADFKKYGFDFTPKMSYALSLFFVLAGVDSIYQYLHTHKYPGENDDGSFGGVGMALKDLYYPRNGAKTKSGEDDRVSMPTYLKDIVQSGVPALLTGHPFTAADNFTQMIKNKSAPELSMIFDLLNNEDFYGNEIRNPHDNNLTQTKQVAIYIASQLLPFSISQQQNLASGKSTLEQQAEAFLGIVSAPSTVVQSAYDAQLSALYQDQVGGFAPETPEGAAAQAQKSAVVAQIKKGDYSGVEALLKAGIIKPAGLRTFIANALMTTPQKEYKYLTPQNKATLINGQ